MTISSINLAMAGSYGAYSQKLSSATRNKLIELGIPFSQNITEEEGKRLIQQALVQKNQESQGSNKNQDNLFQGGSQKDNDLYQKAKELAERLGVAVSEHEEFKMLLQKIENALETKIQTAQNNESKLKELQGLSRELANIQAQATGSSGYDNTNRALLMSLEMLSEYNKSFLK